MAGLVTSVCQTMLDAQFPTTGATDYVGYSENGADESSNLARTNIGAANWASATAADPSVKANVAAVTSAAATGAATFSHFAIMDSGGTLRSDWTAFTGGNETLAVGDKLEFAAGDLEITLT